MNKLAFSNINNVIPSWDNLEYRTKLMKQLSNYSRDMGFNMNSTNPELILMVYKAMLFDKMVTGHNSIKQKGL